MPSPTCIGFHVDCGVMVKGVLGVAMGIVLFVGSVYLLLSAVLGRWMAYLVVAVSLFGWLAVLSSLWFFGYWSQGPATPTNQGPRGAQPAWTILAADLSPQPVRYKTFESYPNGSAWRAPGTNKNDQSSVLGVSGVIQEFMAEKANEELGIDDPALDPNALLPASITVQDVKFATGPDGKTPLAAARAFYTGGGPALTVLLYHDSGSVPRYSAMFLGTSIILFALHLPLLDRAEKKRKEFLTGGTSPAWYGPA
ncbi:MAG: hypothetical protein HY240_04465 [Actinobacteria bacterium]|nr:hypothetical protein [Actinomycetota bacterium]